MNAYEKLGAFYLGRLYDPSARAIRDELMLYDSKDLTTHAVCVGMTGSGKTGLCLSLLEEAAIDGIPAIAIDPKGDLGNLALTFPQLAPADFLPWIDPGAAARSGSTPEEFAAAQAALWRKGLADWGQDGERIARFRDAVELAIYTPGSSAGRPVRVLRSFAAPEPALLDDGDALRERITTSASSLLTLLGVDADPVTSREHILLSSLLGNAWTQRRDLDVATLIREIQTPPIERVGVMELDTFYPSSDRFALAMRLNNLLASPGFAAWMEGEPLQIQRLLWNPEGRPKLSVLSIAHLSEPERMFFVTQLLNEVVAWMRGQPGTSSLRALLYMDEIFGFFPPTANPPSKRPMLTLLKQARAYGLGVVLSTQNPVDLDYKGLSNTGTWFLGRLQTERDKARVLDGLEGASTASGARFDRAATEATLAGLDSRVFLMNNVHDDRPTLFHTRWALSYLSGPLTRAQLRELTREGHGVAGEPRETRRRDADPADAGPRAEGPVSTDPPVLEEGIEQRFVEPVDPVSGDETLLYRPALLATAQLHYVRARDEIDDWREIALLAPLEPDSSRDVWKEASVLDGAPSAAREPVAAAVFDKLPAAAAKARTYDGWRKRLATKLYREQKLELLSCRELKLSSRPGESEAEFRIRLSQAVRERRDLEVAKLEKRYAPKLARLRDRIRRAEERVEREQAQYGQQKLQTAISIGATVLGAMFGRKVASVGTVGRAGTAMRGVGRASREKGEVARAAEALEIERQRLETLEAEFRREIESVRDAADPAALEIERTEIAPRKSDITVERLTLAWVPWRLRADGVVLPAIRG